MRSLVLAMCLLLTACSGDRFPPASPVGIPDAVVPGYENIRFWGDEEPTNVSEYLDTMRGQVRERAAREGAPPNGGTLDVLILSGGGSDGAFGAGLLNGWTAHGDRPEFGLVTGVSTGALIAPLAFLGSDYDAELKDLFTNNSTETIVQFTPLKGIFQGFGLTDTTRIEARMARVITPRTVARIAEEHRKGRRLWIGTTNLDAQRPEIWDIGAIAASGRGDAPSLIQRIMLASASVPGAFPPVLIEVEHEGRRWSEMHMDGGVTRQLFFYPPQMLLPEPESGPGVMRRGTIYAIRNTKLAPDYQPIEAGILPITVRSIVTLIKSSGGNDLLILKAQAQSGEFQLRMTAVPEDFDMKEREFFDLDYMRALYQVGYDQAERGVQWADPLAGASPVAVN